MNLDTSKPIKSVSYNGVDVPLFQEAPVLLWTNASPTSQFAAQSVTVAAYDGYLIECRRDTSDATTSKNFFVFTNTNNQYCSVATGYTTASYALRSVKKSGNTLTFGYGFARSQGNGDCIPTRIWGVKFTL